MAAGPGGGQTRRSGPTQSRQGCSGSQPAAMPLAPAIRSPASPPRSRPSVLVLIVPWPRRRDPETTEEEEYLENLFDVVASCLLLPENRAVFVEAEGALSTPFPSPFLLGRSPVCVTPVGALPHSRPWADCQHALLPVWLGARPALVIPLSPPPPKHTTGVELLLLILRAKRAARRSALKCLDFATTRCPAACDRLVDQQGLKTLFAIFMGKLKVSRPPQHRLAHSFVCVEGEGGARRVVENGERRVLLFSSTAGGRVGGVEGGLKAGAQEEREGCPGGSGRARQRFAAAAARCSAAGSMPHPCPRLWHAPPAAGEEQGRCGGGGGGGALGLHHLLPAAERRQAGKPLPPGLRNLAFAPGTRPGSLTPARLHDRVASPPVHRLPAGPPSPLTLNPHAATPHVPSPGHATTPAALARCILTLWAGLSPCSSPQSRHDRVAAKFVEAEFEKCDRLVELFFRYEARVAAEEAR